MGIKSKLILLFLVLFFFNCKTILLKENDYSFKKLEGLINTDFILKKDEILSGHGKIYSYHLKDSSVFYFGKGEDFIYNENEIAKKVSSFILHVAQNEGKTMVLEGVKPHGIYWKHKIVGMYFIGYIQTSKNGKRYFDKVIKQVNKISEF